MTDVTGQDILQRLDEILHLLKTGNQGIFAPINLEQWGYYLIRRKSDFGEIDFCFGQVKNEKLYIQVMGTEYEIKLKPEDNFDVVSLEVLKKL